MIIDIHSDADLDREFIEKKGFVLLELGASWCRPCQVMAPAFQAVETQFENQVRLCRIDVDEQEEMAERFGLEGVPTFVFFKDGKEKGRIIGYRQKNKFFEDIDRLMKKE
ncbi:thioredoxin family protein [Dialister sp.]|uniref:thioredoxin family protein n=1 Tax=Dialister sp. TaxID=1955814 RepID=UPI003F0A7E45